VQYYGLTFIEPVIFISCEFTTKTANC